MENPGNKNIAFSAATATLIIYEITFTLFVIYYVQGGLTWFRISFMSIAISVFIAFIKTFRDYRQWNASSAPNKKTISLLADFLFFALYLFCLLVQADQWKAPFLPNLIIIPFLAIPPLAAFIEFLYSDARKHPGVSNNI